MGVNQYGEVSGLPEKENIILKAKGYVCDAGYFDPILISSWRNEFVFFSKSANTSIKIILDKQRLGIQYFDTAVGRSNMY